MGSKKLSEEVAAMREALFEEGVLDKHFLQIEDLEASGVHEFVEELTTVYLRDSTKYIRTVEDLLENMPADYNKLEHNAYLVRGSSASIGAKKVQHLAGQLQELCERRDFQSAKSCLQQVKREHDIFRAKIEPYIELRKRANSASTSNSKKN